MLCLMHPWHFSVGTSCSVKFREPIDNDRIIVISTSHGAKSMQPTKIREFCATGTIKSE
jgi:trehalose utilization protein